MAQARVAVILTATGALLRWENRATPATFNAATETQAALMAPVRLADGVPVHHHKVASGIVVEMTEGEKDAVDAVRVPAISIRATSKLVDGWREITQAGSTDWQEIGGVVANPAAFVQRDPVKAFGRIVFAYRTIGAGARFRIREDDGTGAVNLRTSPSLVDTGDAVKVDAAVDTITTLRMTRNLYIIDAQLNGATSAWIGYASITLIERD